ncbi:hypothetical protein L6452_36696 [Arctium lappa]|uniref:Uncharacterized protein n=1 Tax=Arctium lappa TaxID=4217 RepID=A0ACB8Y999_ARCLA|nr:hypothetical protein L6452_36696 [Arctium lappa]
MPDSIFTNVLCQSRPNPVQPFFANILQPTEPPDLIPSVATLHPGYRFMFPPLRTASAFLSAVPLPSRN